MTRAYYDKLPKIGKKALNAIQKGVEEGHPISYMEQLGIGQRLINLLEQEGIQEIGDLMRKKKEDLSGYKNFGEKQLQSLFKALANYHKMQ